MVKVKINCRDTRFGAGQFGVRGWPFRAAGVKTGAKTAKARPLTQLSA